MSCIWFASQLAIDFPARVSYVLFSPAHARRVDLCEARGDLRGSKPVGVVLCDSFPGSFAKTGNLRVLNFQQRDPKLGQVFAQVFCFGPTQPHGARADSRPPGCR